MQRVRGELVVDQTKTEASDATIPLPKITRRVLVDHRDRQATEQAEAGELWTDLDLVLPTTPAAVSMRPSRATTTWTVASPR